MMDLGDYGASVVRTAVSYVWGLLLTILVNAATGAPAELAEILDEAIGLLSSETVTGAITIIVGLAWYALWRRLEPRIPNWISAILLGSARRPENYTLAA